MGMDWSQRPPGRQRPRCRSDFGCPPLGYRSGSGPGNAQHSARVVVRGGESTGSGTWGLRLATNRVVSSGVSSLPAH